MLPGAGGQPSWPEPSAVLGIYESKNIPGAEMSDLYCRDKRVTSASPLLRGANGLPRLQVATCPKVTRWLWKEGDEAFPTGGWSWSGFPSLLPPGSVGEEPSTH